MLGLYAGSFDPPHLGHIDVAEAAASRCSYLWVAAVENPSKTGGMFTLSERRDLLEASLAHLPNTEILAYSGLLVRLAEDLGVDAFFRGASKDLTSELVMASMNEAMSKVPTLFVPASATHANLSSHYVRGLYGTGGASAVRDLVPTAVFNALSASELVKARGEHH